LVGFKKEHTAAEENAV